VSDDPTPRELTRELTRLASAIEELAREIKSEFSTLRQETVRRDVYEAEAGRVGDEQERQNRRLEELERRGRGLVTAVTGMLLAIVGGVVIAIMSRGLL
jgi:hypothetical protein